MISQRAANASIPHDRVKEQILKPQPGRLVSKLEPESLPAHPPTLAKAATGITGLDEITGGGLPRGRPTLVCGGPGSGKTMLAMEFLVRGATQFGEPGVFVMFEENEAELADNGRSLGFDLDGLVAQKKMVLDYVHIERTEFEETGDYDLEGLFIRLGHAIDSIGAKRVVLDTLEALFAGLPNHAVLRAELRRLFRWLKDRGMTAVITAERGDAALTRYGLEEYVADCVITLDHRVTDQISTRRLRVVKYRGTAHGTNEYPFLMGARGFSVLPITSLMLDHRVSVERIPTGIAALDEMLGGGVYRGGSVLISGPPGTGKSSIGAKFAETACRRGERSVVFAYEESPEQVLRNMRSIGIDLARWVKKGLLQIHSSRPSMYGLEQHLMMMHDIVEAFQPRVVVVDPISNPTSEDRASEVNPTLMRLIDFLKKRQITAVFTSIEPNGFGKSPEDTQSYVASLMDTWLPLRNMESNGERNRALYVAKSRGMAHSNQVREFVLSGAGIDVVDVYLDADRVLTGAARIAQAGRGRAFAEQRQEEHARKLRQLAAKRKALEAQIAVLQAEGEVEAAEVMFTIAQDTLKTRSTQQNTDDMAYLRGGTRCSNGRRTKGSTGRTKGKR